MRDSRREFLAGGLGRTWKVVIGTLLIVLVQNGMNLMQVGAYAQTIAIGAILIFCDGTVASLMRTEALRDRASRRPSRFITHTNVFHGKHSLEILTPRPYFYLMSYSEGESVQTRTLHHDGLERMVRAFRFFAAGVRRLRDGWKRDMRTAAPAQRPRSASDTAARPA